MYRILIAGIMAAAVSACSLTPTRYQEVVTRYDRIVRVMQSSQSGHSLTLWMRRDDGTVRPLDGWWFEDVAIHDNLPAGEQIYAPEDSEHVLSLHLHSMTELSGETYHSGKSTGVSTPLQ